MGGAPSVPSGSAPGQINYTKSGEKRMFDEFQQLAVLEKRMVGLDGR